MKKVSKKFMVLGILLLAIGLTFGIKNKFIDKTVEILVRGNSITYKTNKKYNIPKNTKGVINVELDIDNKGFYSVEFEKCDNLEFYYDENYTKKVKKVYKTYNGKTIDKMKFYYKNNGKTFNNSINVNVKKSSTNTTMKNKALTKEYFWNDDYRPYIESISFIKDENFVCQNLCFDISDNISSVYANLIKNDSRYNLQIISDTTIYFPTDSSYLFSDFENLKTIKFNNVSTKYTQNMSYMFSNNPNIEELDLSSFDTNNIQNIEGMFLDSINLKEIDLSTFKFDNINTNNLLKNINEQSTIYVKSSVEQAWIFGPNNISKPSSWKAKNVLVK